MNIADAFLWLHLPKTGGTSMNRLFREHPISGVEIDPDDTSQNHDSVALRESRGSWRAGAQQRCITIRRLDQWLISLRLRYLDQYVLPLLPAGKPPFQTPPRDNAKPTGLSEQPRFSSSDLERIAAVNPRWSSWQQRVYGR